MDKKNVQGDPESPEITTPSEEDVEEIVRQLPPVRRSGIERFGDLPRLIRPPRIRLRKGPGDYRMTDSQGQEAMAFSMLDIRRSVEGSDASISSAMTTITSAASSCTDPWSSSGFVEDQELDSGDLDGHMPTMKLEPDDDVKMPDIRIREGPVREAPSTINQTPLVAKRPRGRPRKYPKLSPESMAKVGKGRSKTGCITCRKRKKKCDERKPGCMNCEKNAIDCEGYREKTIWKSGKERAEEARLRSVSLPNIKLPAMINGVETAGDMMFFEHYIFRLSSIFTVEGEQNNAFKCMLLPMAVQHPGLMHSILALSSKHIDYRSSYGIKFLKDHPEVDIETLERRSLFHQHEALNELNADIERQKKGDKPNVTLPATFGQMLCLVLETLSDPNPKGLHRVHLEAYQSLVKECPPEDGEFQKFIHEFFQYHICADELIALPADRVRLSATCDDWNLPTTIVQPDAVRLLGVSDGLFLYMSKITNIRNEVRENLQNGIDPPVGYNALYAAALIDAGIREWKPVWPAGDSRDRAGLLYKQMMWVYLWRTIHPPRCSSWEPNAKITEAVNDGIKILSSFDPRDPSQTLILAPAFVLGCAAFEPAQREPIRKAIGVVKAYMEYRNSDTALEVLEEVWRLMDAKDERSWDWQTIAHGMGMDFLAT